MKSLAAAAFSAVMMASAAGAQALSLYPGKTINVRFGNDKAIVERVSPAEPMNKYETYLLLRAEGQMAPPGAKVMPPQFATEGEGPAGPPRPSGDELRITMLRVPDADVRSREITVLFFENGYGSALRYHAEMHSGDRSAVTDVCDVAPHTFGVEYWPYPLDKLDISDVKLVSFNGQIQCG
jgi:hypothetical protein